MEKKLIGKRIQKKFDSSIERVRKKGHERLTIMVIPHGHDRIFSLQLNWSMILFLSGTVFLAVVLSIYGIYWQTIKRKEIAQLKSLYGVNFNSAVTLQVNSKENIEKLEETLGSIREISEIIGIPESELAIIPDTDDSENRAAKILYTEVLKRLDMGPGTNFLPPVYSLRTLRTMMDDESPLIASVNESLNKGIGVYYSMPLGRPFQGTTAFADTSGYGLRSDPVNTYGFELHMGFDSAGAEGTPIYATAPGTVFMLYSWDPGYGNAVVIQHEHGFFTLYGHLARYLVQSGAQVQKGQLIGEMGRTGRVTGVHLHYEVWLGNGIRTDPLPFICSVDLLTPTCRAQQSQPL